MLAATPAVAATVNVTAQAELQAAFRVDGNTIVLSDDITFTANQSLNVDPGENITLDLNGRTLIITNPGGNPAIGVPATSSLTINATGGGTINATGGDLSAGIGGGNRSAVGTTTINGGTINATGGGNGAGIGGGNGSAGGRTIINGGTINATGGNYSAGIGGGINGSRGVFNVNGTPVGGAATNGGDSTVRSNASPITNPVQPAGIGYSATTSGVGTGGRIELLFNYLATFTPNGGSITANQTINYDGTVDEPAAPTREGFTFAGWESTGSAYNFSTRVSEPLTLTATWTAAPEDTTPGDTTPGDTTPGDTTPGDTTPGSGSPGSELAATGADVNSALGIATLLLAGGITLTALRRRATTRST
jgi:uncharacterized repeat protein (TIGR02543 family)